MELRELIKLKNFNKLGAKLSSRLAPTCRYHMTATKLKPLHALTWPQATTDQGIADYKPLGLWYSLGDSWLRYLEKDAEYFEWALFRLDEYKYTYRVDLDFYNKIATLEDKNDFKLFSDDYGVCLPSRGPKHNLLINWEKVALDFEGIEVRGSEDWMHEYMWYDGWDCQSGCVWHPRAIKALRLIKEF